MLKQNLSPYEKALVKLLFAVITLILEGVFIYQYVTEGVIKISPNASMSGDFGLYFVIGIGVFALGFLPYAINQFRDALKHDY